MISLSSLSIHDFLSRRSQVQVLDVRTPAEFAKGHIPGAVNMPLFEDQERVIVGTLYKEEGHERAFLKGLELVGPRLPSYVLSAKAAAPSKTVLLYCWRGGMRSQSLCQLLRAAGMEAHILEGGYKSFRAYIQSQYIRPQTLWALGGLTGSGKTALLHQLKAASQQVIDLEGFAKHLGSAFGTLGYLIQPTQEDFENALGLELAALDADKPTWIEDECINIGRVMLPAALWTQLKQALLILIQVPELLRKQHLLSQYGHMDRDFMKQRFLKIERRLGSELTKRAMRALEEDSRAEVLDIALAYYDKSYLNQLSKNPRKTIIFNMDNLDFEAAAIKLKEFAYHEAYAVR